MTETLLGRKALVTGSTDGIGAAIAGALAEAGAQVIITGRDAVKGEKMVAELGGRATFVRADLAEGGPVVRALAAAAGPVDILVNNAAMLLDPTPTGEVPEDVIDRALAINIKAAFLLTGLVAPAMAERGSGVIVNLGSINGFAGSARSALYSMTKAAMHSLTKSWASEYAESGVRINAVAPGPTMTGKVTAMADRLAPMIARFPSRRPSTPDEVARAVLFLAGDGAANIHGAVLPVDGGASAI